MLDIKLKPLPPEVSYNYTDQIARAASVGPELSGTGTFKAIVPTWQEDGREAFKPRLFYHPGLIASREGLDNLILKDGTLYRRSPNQDDKPLNPEDLRRTATAKIEIRQAGRINGVAALLPPGLAKRGHQKWLKELGDEYTLQRERLDQVGVIVVGPEWTGLTVTVVRFWSESWSRAHIQTHEAAVLRRGLRPGGETLIPSETRFYLPPRK